MFSLLQLFYVRRKKHDRWKKIKRQRIRQKAALSGCATRRPALSQLSRHCPRPSCVVFFRPWPL